MWAGAVNRAAVASSVIASLATLAVCLFHNRTDRSGIVGTWVAFELPRSRLEPWAAPLPAAPIRAAPSAATHEPYATSPPSFLASRGYKTICRGANSQGEWQQRPCAVEAHEASRLAAQQCTPENLRRWDGVGSWFKDSKSHYKCVACGHTVPLC